MLLQVRALSKSYGALSILSEITFALNADERAGVVGINGAGKSTLLRILVGDEVADAGSVAYAPGLDIGYLPQTQPDFAGQRIGDLIAESVGGLCKLEARMRELEVAMTTASAGQDALLEEYGQVASQFQDRGGYELDARIDAVLAGLRLAYLPRERDVATLSGGEKARVGLAALLLRAPDVLLLDEPTSHLDAASLEWLEQYLAAYPGAALIVSHDRQFLNRAVNHIFEIDEHTHGLKRYAGNYDAYRAAKASERERWEESFARQQEEIKELRKRIREAARPVGHNRPPRDNDKSAYKGKGEWVADAVSRNVRAAEEQLRRIEADPIPKPPKLMRFQPHFHAEALQGQTVARAEGLSKRYGDRHVLRNVSFALAAEARVVLVGPNGAGKTTLLRLLLGLETPDVGRLRVTPGARIGYLAQEPQATDLDRTVFETYRAGLVGYESNLVAGILGNGLFRLEDLTKTVGQLSPGQQRKLELARLIAEGPNMLLLDEPTNYISLDVLEAFEAAVRDFPGPVLAVSHDRWFLQRFGGEVWELVDGTLTIHPAGTTVPWAQEASV